MTKKETVKRNGLASGGKDFKHNLQFEHLRTSRVSQKNLVIKL